jgi:hypothetical protein
MDSGQRPSVRWSTTADSLSPSSTTSHALSIQSAINEPLPMSRLRPPRLLQLANATMPTASLSTYSAPAFPPPVHIHTRRGSSIESLRSASSHRSPSASSAQSIDSPPQSSSWSWWQPQRRKRATASLSIDSLRTINTADKPDLPPSLTPDNSPFLASPWSWWQSKGDVDRLLDDSDQAETVSEEQDNIRKKCKMILGPPSRVSFF